MDRLTPDRRSHLMSRIGSSGTGPERTARMIIRKLGRRFRANARDLPGSPDIVLDSPRMAIMVNGCFWHQHEGCRLARMPKSNLGYWMPKLAANRLRDARALARLKELRWRMLVIWECQLRRPASAAAVIRRFLRIPGAQGTLPPPPSRFLPRQISARSSLEARSSARKPDAEEVGPARGRQGQAIQNLAPLLKPRLGMKSSKHFSTSHSALPLDRLRLHRSPSLVTILPPTQLQD
jgi:DNA mismatch endonuclease, patch repair protein